ncbi:hypothetical protein FGB62_14g020 [Gracilaria domingensis]|nr:hypothetical protein FGB62_14g020 [Gracilaria domingensis]
MRVTDRSNRAAYEDDTRKMRGGFKAQSTKAGFLGKVEGKGVDSRRRKTARRASKDCRGAFWLRLGRGAQGGEYRATTLHLLALGLVVINLKQSGKLGHEPIPAHV